MKVLWVSSVCPLPATDGNRQRNLHLLKGVAERHEVVVVCPVTEAERGSLRDLEALCDRVLSVPARSPRGRSAWRRIGARLRSMLARRPPFLPPELDEMTQAATQIAGEWHPDVAFGGIYVAPALAMAEESRLVLDDQNVEEELYRRLWRREHRPLRKVSRFLDWFAVRSFERRWLQRASLVTVCSERDQEILARIVPSARLEVVPNGADLSMPPSDSARRQPETLVMAGGMSYAPNIDGAQHLVKEVMPIVWAERPSARLILVGKDPSPEVRALAGMRVEVTGGVPDVRVYLDCAALTVVPLRVGGGTRLKLLEAMVAGVPIVSTEVGAEGLGLRHGEEAWLANDADGLAAGVLRLLSDPATAHSLAVSARARAARDLNWEQLGTKLAVLLDSHEDRR